MSRARARTAPSRPRSASTGGWMPRTTERRSAIAALVASRASLTVRRARLGVGVELRLGQAEAHRHRDQPRLRPVVQVALEPAQLGGRVVHRLGAAAGQGGHALARAAPGEPRVRKKRSTRERRAISCGVPNHQKNSVATASISTTTTSETTQPTVIGPQDPREVAPRHRVADHAPQPRRTAHRPASAGTPEAPRCPSTCDGDPALTLGDRSDQQDRAEHDRHPDPDDGEHAADHEEHAGRGAAAPATAPARRRTP